MAEFKDMVKIAEDKSAQVVDVRNAKHFFGQEQEPTDSEHYPIKQIRNSDIYYKNNCSCYPGWPGQMSIAYSLT